MALVAAGLIPGDPVDGEQAVIGEHPARQISSLHAMGFKENRKLFEEHNHIIKWGGGIPCTVPGTCSTRVWFWGGISCTW